VNLGWLRFVVMTIALLMGVVYAPAHLAQASGMPAAADLPPLEDFVQQLINGQAGQVRGVYAPGLFADIVIQQPSGNPDFVSDGERVLTQFASASDAGSIGLLAHNYLAGRRFSEMELGQHLILIRGDGSLETFAVTRMLRFRALQPYSTRSRFEDLAAGGELDAADVFMDTYAQQGAMVFQTCISHAGIPTWGRLFVIARPSRVAGFAQDFCDSCE
jgi:hypothetical protein